MERYLIEGVKVRVRVRVIGRGGVKRVSKRVRNRIE